MAPCFRIHPQNLKLFEFRGRPRVLVCATEHYGSVFNRPFRFERYLADAAAKAQTLTRLFLLFREFQGPLNPYSTCKPESTDYLAPFPRTGPGGAADRLPKYDLDRWDPEFFERLHRFVSLAGDQGVVVEVVLFSNTYGDDVWAVNPLHPRNNINGVEPSAWFEYTTRRHARLFAYQCAHARKIATELNRYDNLFYEICNEPGGDIGVAGAPPVAEVNEWQAAIAGLIRETEAELPRRHLIAGQEAFSYKHDLPEQGPVRQWADHTFGAFPVDIVNMHPLPNMTLGGKVYHLGGFMAGDLRLAELQQYCLDAYPLGKPLNLDEDNSATRFRDEFGWTIHRKRAWTALHCGAHYDCIDFSILPYLETGTEASQAGLRTWMKHLSEYIHSLPLVEARPLPGLVRRASEHTLASAFGAAGKEYSVYLADRREAAELGAGEPLRGELELDLPAGDYRATWFSPTAGTSSAPVLVAGGRPVRLTVPSFRQDVALRVSPKPADGGRGSRRA